MGLRRVQNSAQPIINSQTGEATEASCTRVATRFTLLGHNPRDEGPFHKRTLHPVHEEFEVGKLYRAKLVSVMQEIPRSSYLPQRALFENQMKLPRELGLRIHRELYSSEAFIDAHRDLNNSLYRLEGLPIPWILRRQRWCQVPSRLLYQRFANKLSLLCSHDVWHCENWFQAKLTAGAPSCAPALIGNVISS